jgi:hypothetical protein
MVSGKHEELMQLPWLHPSTLSQVHPQVLPSATSDTVRHQDTYLKLSLQ